MKTSWVNALPEVLVKDNTDLIDDMFEWLVDPCLTFVRKQCKVSDRTCTNLSSVEFIVRTCTVYFIFILVLHTL